MSQSRSRKRARPGWSIALGAGLLLTSALGACASHGGPGAAPLDSGSADAGDATPGVVPLSTTTPATVSLAPPVTALPVGQSVRLRRVADRRERFGYLDRAVYQENAVEDAPPDYLFEDGGVRLWAWTTGQGARVICEPVAGGYRTYTYQAGSETPYLVRDLHYAYAYDGGALVAVFTAAGLPIDLADGAQPVIYAGRYLDRGHALWRAASTRPHLAVNAYVWSDRRADLAAQRVAWQRQMDANPDWAAWNGAHRDEEQRLWTDARAQHEAAAQQFGVWQQQRFRGAPPQLYPARRPAPGRASGNPAADGVAHRAP